MFSFVSFLGRLPRGLTNFVNVYKDPNFDFADFLRCCSPYSLSLFSYFSYSLPSSFLDLTCSAFSPLL